MSKNPMAPYVSYIQWAESCVDENMTYDEYVASAKENDKVVLSQHEYDAIYTRIWADFDNLIERE